MMQEDFGRYNQEHRLFSPADRLVLAVSGGVDSMVMCDLLRKSGADFVMAHCNFHLRGDESDGDERFVCDYAERNGLRCFVKHFDTQQYAAEHGVSIEMAARDLRYEWFEELRQQLGRDKIVLAHHADDQAETFFINLLRGAGLHGLKGMKPENGVLIRPLLWASREQILAYAKENGIAWREDRTNAESVYLRNKIRNVLMPVFDGISAEARRSIGKSVGYLAAEEGLYREMLQEKLSQIVVEKDSCASVAKACLKGPNGFQLLFEWLRDYGFNTDQCRFVYSSLDGEPGRRFFSPGHEVSVERDKLQLKERREKDEAVFVIEKGQTLLTMPFHMSLSCYEKSVDFEMKKSKEVALLDMEKVEFPLVLRHWRQGDRFRPLGMKGMKLLSDFFVDQKLTNAQKEAQWLLLSAKGEVLWVVGRRIDDRAKVTVETNSILECCLL